MNDAEQRIVTLRGTIAWNKAFLECVPPGADPKTEQQIAKDKAELAELLATKEAA